MSAGRELLVTSLDTVRTRRQRWAWADLVPLGVATILAGRGGIGKSTILAWLAAQLTTGGLGGDFHGAPVTVGVICGEDNTATTLVPRLTAAGADRSRVLDLSAVRTTTEQGDTWTGLPTLVDDLGALRQAICDHGIQVLIVDPIVSMMSGDSNKLTDVRHNLDPVASLASELGIAVILVAHFGKGGGNAGDKLSGSHAFRDVARSVLLVAVDDETGQRIVSVDKANYTRVASSLAFTITSATVATDDDETTTVGRARLLGKTQLSVQAILDRRDDHTLAETSSSILEIVNGATGPVTPAEVATMLGIDNKMASKYMQRLAASGRIAHSSRGEYSRLSTPGEPSPTGGSGLSGAEIRHIPQITHGESRGYAASTTKRVGHSTERKAL